LFDEILTIFLDGAIYASWLFIVAVGLTFVFGVLKILNIAHGGIYALGAYSAATIVPIFYTLGLPEEFVIIAMLFSALAVAIVITPIMERGLLRRFYGQDEVLIVLVTYAIYLVLEDVQKLIWGMKSFYVSEPREILGGVEMGSLYYVGYDLALIGLAIFCGLTLWLTLNKTRSGKIVLAVIHNPEISGCMGVNINKVYLAAFFVGAFLAALAGSFTAPLISVQVGISVAVVIESFAVVIIGGLGSIPGAVIGALIIGMARAACVHKFPEAEIFIMYFCMAGMLIFRPKGLFQGAQARKI
jgi:branched-chain amino acid transport system permease protein